MFLLGPPGQPLDDEALLAHYLPADRARPLVRANFVTSADGAVTVEGFSAGLSGEPDQRVFRLLRMVCDGLLVGAGTIRHENYRAVRLDADRRAWRVAHGLAEYPTLVVVSARLSLPPNHPALADAPVRPIVVTHAAAGPAAEQAYSGVADVIALGDDEVDLPAVVAGLNRRGLRHLLSEGGPHLLAALTAADLLDELCLTVAPVLTGPGEGRITAGPPAPHDPRRYRLGHALLADDSLLLRYTR